MSDLTQSIDYLSSSGFVLSTEHKACLQTSLVVLKDDGKFKAVKYWGKISGIDADYFVAVGFGANPLSEKSHFFSLDCINWVQIPQPEASVMENAGKARGRFRGNPSHEYKVALPLPEDADPEAAAAAEPEYAVVLEEQRLAAVLKMIDDDTALLPRGAMLKTPTGAVAENRAFEGLSLEAGRKAASFLHFREPVNLPKKSLLERENLDQAIDFLDPISEDLPAGSWSIQEERGGTVVVVRSLLWPGFTFFAVPNSRRFGHVYSGTGERNDDLGFMLS